jgi:hypothetical protein
VNFAIDNLKVRQSPVVEQQRACLTAAPALEADDKAETK